MSAHQPEVIGLLAPRCPRCGWQAIDRPYTETNQAEQEAAATADVVAHKAECPGSPDVRSSPVGGDPA